MHQNPDSHTFVIPSDLTFNCNRGRALFILRNEKAPTKTCKTPKSYPLLAADEKRNRMATPYAVSLSAGTCQLTSVSGGKGASLALMQSCHDLRDRAKIPDGIVVTSAGFQEQLKRNPEVDAAISELDGFSQLLCTEIREEKLDERRKNLQDACDR